MTNGVISILVDGKMAMKIVVGCDGYRAPTLVAELRASNRLPGIEQARRLARDYGFGCRDCLVIQTQTEDFYSGPLGERYRATFNDPEANPRWEHKADWTEIISLGAEL